MVLLAGAVFLALLTLLASIPLLGFTVGVFLTAYFATYFLNIIEFAMTGKDNLPDWPVLSDLWQDVILVFFRFIGLFLLCFGPPLILSIILSEDDSRESLLGLLFHALGIAYFPMAVLGIYRLGSTTRSVTRYRASRHPPNSSRLPYRGRRANCHSPPARNSF